MSVQTRHPQITATRQDEWDLMAAAAEGEGAMKAAREAYLPKPGGFASHPDKGAAAYASYIGRAQFPEILAPSISAMVGIIHGKKIQIEMPDALAFLDEDADGSKLPLDAFHRRITRNLLTIGRYGVLADAPEGGGNPFLAGYVGQSVINWDTDWFVLDESYYARDEFEWELTPRFRVLSLVDGKHVSTVYEGESLTTGTDLEPRGIGGKLLDFVPFAIATARDVVPDVETPPLIGVARAALANYQLNADYRHQLYMSGQETLVAINGDAPEYVGAGAVHAMSGGDGITPDLKYVSPSCSGIEAHGKAMEDNRTAAIMAGARLLEQSDSVQESGEARKLRFASETASLTSIAQTSCALLEGGLKNVAKIQGLNPVDVTVTPPRDLLDHSMTPTDAAALVTVWQKGGVSYQTLYESLQRGGIASPERDHEAEFALIDGDQFRDEAEGP